MTQINSKFKVASLVLVTLSAILMTSTAYSFASPNLAGSPAQMPAITTASSMSISQYSVNIANKPGVGSYLTNATGYTLYTFARDVPSNGTSRCTSSCTTNWPVFYATNLHLATGLNATSFTVIARLDGSKQLAYRGWPLYYFRNDTKPGDTNGQGFAKAWFACTFPTPSTTSVAFTTTTTSVAKTSTTPEHGGY